MQIIKKKPKEFKVILDSPIKVDNELKELKVILASPIRVDSSTPLKIELIEKSKPEKAKKWSKKSLWLLIGGIWLISSALGFIFFIYVYPKELPPLNSEHPSLNSLVSYPTYAAYGDDYNIELTLINKTKRTVKDIKAVFIYSNDIPVITDSGGSSAINFGDLNGEERKTREIKIPVKHAVKKKEIKFYIKLIAKDFQDKVLKNDYTIKMSPIPFVKNIFKFLIALLAGVVFIPIIQYLLKNQLLTIASNISKSIESEG